MNAELNDLLREIEQDMSADVAVAFAALAAGYFERSARGDRPVTGRRSPEDLLKALPPITGAGKPVAQLAEMLQRDVVNESNWLYHPRYMGHQVTAPLPIAVWTESLIGALNQSVAVREMSPSITVVERQIIEWMNGLAGFGMNAGGTFTSGGTEATFTALLAARAALLPDAWENGLGGELPVVLCGEHAHYAVTRAAAQLGLGLKGVITIRSKDFRMDPEDLAMKLAETRARGQKIMAVVATAGSTPTGSFDDLETVGRLCDEHGVWFHVDGAHGASALLSASRRSLLRGIERARSVAWDPHKMMLMPLSAGVLLVRNEADLDAAFRQKAPYLFHESPERGWDQGGRSFQCSRRADALKLWVALQRYGADAFGLLFDRFCELTAELAKNLTATGTFQVMNEPQCNILCFRYVGPLTPNANGLDQINLRLREDYNQKGTGWITTTILNGVRVLRTTLLNPRIRSQHLRDMVLELQEIATGL